MFHLEVTMPAYEHEDGHVEVTVAGSRRDRELDCTGTPEPVADPDGDDK